MVITQIIGGLGNQLFQYAIGRRMAEIYHVPLKLDISGFQQYPLRKYYLHHLRIAEDIATAEEVAAVQENVYVRENCFQQFHPEVLEVHPPLYLEGYWQTEKYFADIKEIIHQEIIVKEPPDQANKEMADQISQCEAVAVHIRRGDYVLNPITNYIHGVCPFEYYERAFDELNATVKEPHFFIFSDDWQWAGENLKMDYPTTFMTVNGPDQCHEDLRLMSLCKHHIVANSSFSWWGAWLAAHPAQKVFAPGKWFNIGYNTRDLLPQGWVAL